MPRVRMYHAGGDRFQFASQAAFEAEHCLDGWVLASEDEAPAEPAPEAEAEVADEPVVDAPARGRGRRS